MITNREIIKLALRIVIGSILLIVGLLSMSFILSIYDYTIPIQNLFIKSIIPMILMIMGLLIIFYIGEPNE